MPRIAKVPDPAKAPDLTSVRKLVTSVTKLAHATELTPNAIYRWIRVNRIPGKYINVVANLYDVEIRDLIPLTGSDKANVSRTVLKPKGTLQSLMEVYQGKMTLVEVAAALGVSKRSLHLVMYHWGDELPTLYSTFKQLEEKRISLDEACQRLKVTKFTLHGLRRKYGYAPGRVKKPTGPSAISIRREAQRLKVLEIVAGKLTAEQGAKDLNTSYRSIFRHIEAVSPLKIRELTEWPMSLRAALADEIDRKLPNYSIKWKEFIDSSRIVMKKRSKFPKTPENFTNEPIKRLLVAVLLDEATLEAVAAARKADPTILAGLFSGDLKPLGVSFERLMELPITHQVAAAEILLGVLDRKRRVE